MNKIIVVKIIYVSKKKFFFSEETLFGEEVGKKF